MAPTEETRWVLSDHVLSPCIQEASMCKYQEQGQFPEKKKKLKEKQTNKKPKEGDFKEKKPGFQKQKKQKPANG